jgi:hypothetical protein
MGLGQCDASVSRVDHYEDCSAPGLVGADTGPHHGCQSKTEIFAFMEGKTFYEV